MLDLQANFGDPLVNIVIMDEHRPNFPESPEKAYLNKEVCVSGVVKMQNNIPYVNVRSREQIKMKAKATLEDIALYIGDSVTVSGFIFSGKYFAESATSPTLLNMGAPFPNQPLTVVIEKADRPFFEASPEQFYLNKEVAVSGTVVLYKGKPQIVVHNKEQLKLLNNNGIMKASNVVTTSTPPPQAMPVSNPAQPTAGAMDEVEKPAEFPGGNDAWVNFLKKNLKVPGQLEENTSKTVEAGFYVTQDGRIENIEIMKSGGKEYDKEVLRVLSLMPRWKPRQKGRLLVGVNVKQPITFKNEGIEL